VRDRGLAAPGSNDVALDALSATDAPPLSHNSRKGDTVAPNITQTIDGSRTTSFGAVEHIDAGLLNVGYVDAGPADGPAVVLIHGWPYDIHSFEEVTPILVAAGFRVIVPFTRGYGTTRFLSETRIRNGQQAALAADTVALMNALDIDTAVIAGFDWGARTANIMAILWPERTRAIVPVSGYLVVSLEANRRPLPPRAEYGWWYQYYFATERGRSGYGENTREFNKLVWKIASPGWDFSDETFARTASAFENPDHVDIVIHNYRWRQGLANGEPEYDDAETILAAQPTIAVPAITIGSDFDGAADDGAPYRAKFAGRYAHKILHGIGQNVPQEAPRAFADAVIGVDAR
jgi:pimeloyl-ACP methyl ester carboxylesterase